MPTVVNNILNAWREHKYDVQLRVYPVSADFLSYLEQQQAQSNLSRCHRCNCCRNSSKISPEIKRIMYLSEQARLGDWNLYQHFTEIRLYVCEILPYSLLVSFPMHIFALKFIRQNLKVDQVNFLPRRKHTLFKLKAFLCEILLLIHLETCKIPLSNEILHNRLWF